MGDVINLRQARKVRNRADDERRAAANRAKHGRTKSEKTRAAAARKSFDAAIDGARREPTEE